MFKKLTAFLFKEVEVIVEEKDEVIVQPVAPIIKVEPIKPVISKIDIDVTETEATEPKPKKRLMIDLDDVVARPVIKQEVKKSVEKPYTPREIISPMYGGATLPDVEETQPVGKSRQPLTKIISPIYGSIASTEGDDLNPNDVYDMSLEDIIQPNFDETEDFQVSLFDVLEGDKD